MTRETGMMDIGRHCDICKKSDFLPFVCPHCQTTYCQFHKLQFNEHNCGKKKIEKVDTSHLPPAKTLFPNLGEIRNSDSNKPKVLITNTQRLGGQTNIKLNSLEMALQRLKKLIPSGKQREKPTALKMAERVKLRKVAKGDARVKMDDRIHIWCTSIENNQKSDKAPIWVSKNWAMGRSLDAIATELKVKNINNRTTDVDEKLYLFNAQFETFNLSSKAKDALKEGDTVYLVKGSSQN